MPRVGISTACFYPDNVKNSLCRVASIGAPVTEVFMNSFGEMSEDMLQDLSATAKNAGTEIISFHPFLSAIEHMFFFSGYAPRVDDGIEIYKRFFEAAAVLGAKYFIFHGEKMQVRDSSPSSLPTELLLSVYDRLISSAESFGITFTQENVTMFRSENTSLIELLRKEFPTIGFALDIKQALRAGKDIDEMIDTMGDRIVQVHLNNYRDGVCTLPLAGTVDMPEIRAKLQNVGYKGDCCIEVYRNNFSDDSELSDSLASVSRIFN